MCEYISWIKYEGRLLYLTSKDLRSKRGKELYKFLLEKHNGNIEEALEDISGHGAIRWFFEIKENKGTNNECTDFSSPDNFPKEIADGIKKGLFKYGICEQILIQPAWKKYEEIQRPAWKKYEEIEQPAWKKYEEIQRPAWKKYEEIEQPAKIECENTITKAFWKIAMVKENRRDEWK